jgi:hypothetical protein
MKDELFCKPRTLTVVASEFDKRNFAHKRVQHIDIDADPRYCNANFEGLPQYHTLMKRFGRIKMMSTDCTRVMQTPAKRRGIPNMLNNVHDIYDIEHTNVWFADPPLLSSRAGRWTYSETPSIVLENLKMGRTTTLISLRNTIEAFKGYPEIYNVCNTIACNVFDNFPGLYLALESLHQDPDETAQYFNEGGYSDTLEAAQIYRAFGNHALFLVQPRWIPETYSVYKKELCKLGWNMHYDLQFSDIGYGCRSPLHVLWLIQRPEARKREQSLPANYHRRQWLSNVLEDDKAAQALIRAIKIDHIGKGTTHSAAS